MDKFRRLATFLAGLTGASPNGERGPRADAVAHGPRAGCNVAILVGLLLMPLIVGAGMAADPDTMAAARSAFVKTAAPSGLAHGKTQPL